MSFVIVLQLAGSQEGAQRAPAFSFFNKDDAVVKTMTATLVRGADWPNGREKVTAITKGEFISQHARLIQVGCMMYSTSSEDQFAHLYEYNLGIRYSWFTRVFIHDEGVGAGHC